MASINLAKRTAVVSTLRSSLFTSLAFLLLFASISFAEPLADILKKELGANPSKSELIRALKKHRPTADEIESQDVMLPKEYTEILFGKKLGKFISTAQDTNPFLHPEAAKYGFMVSNEVEELAEWPYSPIHGQAFYIPRFMIPAEKLQVGNFDEPSEISPEIRKHIFDGEPTARNQDISFWIHPDDLDVYEKFISGGAKNTPKKGYGVSWNFVGIAPNGPRSLMMIDIDHPERGAIWVKVNLHRKLEGSVRLIPPHKAARSVMATRLLEENVSTADQKRWGFRFMPEVAAWSLPFSERSNVVRDLSILESRNVDYVYAYSAFSPSGAESTKDILAAKWLGRNPTKEKFEKLARKVFALMARPFAYNALVTGLNFEWHSANWAMAVTDKGLGDHVVLQDMEALRYDSQIGIWNGGTARSMQSFTEPWNLAKYSNAHGGSWTWQESKRMKDGGYWLEEPEFLGDEYLWRVRGLKESKSPKDQSTIDNLWGYSTIVDVVRNFGIGVMGFKLTNAEVESWMDEEMATAFNEVLRKELKMTKEQVPDVTAKQVLREVMLMRDYEQVHYGGSKPAGVENVRKLIHEEGGLVRALWQVREIRNNAITEKDADASLQKLIAAEADRLNEIQRNTRKDWYDLTKDKGLYFIFHEDARILEARDKEGWLGFFSLEPDGAKSTKAFFESYKKIKGRYPKDATKASMTACQKLLASADVTRRGMSFGDRVAKPKGAKKGVGSND